MICLGVVPKDALLQQKMQKDIGIRGMRLGFNLCVAPSPRNQEVPDFGKCGIELRGRRE